MATNIRCSLWLPTGKWALTNSFLEHIDAPKSRWRDPGAEAKDIHPAYRWTGPGRDGLEVAYGSADSKPNMTTVREV